MRFVRYLAVIALGALAGCAAPESINPHFGNAVRHNMSVHIINPEPRAPEAEGPDLAGKRAAKGMERYEEGRTTAVRPIVTTPIGAGGGRPAR